MAASRDDTPQLWASKPVCQPGEAIPPILRLQECFSGSASGAQSSSIGQPEIGVASRAHNSFSYRGVCY